MDKISRSEARGAGMDKYLTGEPCKFGHRAPRYVSTKNCVECMAQRPDPRWPKKKSSPHDVLKISVKIPRSHVTAIRELAAAFCALTATQAGGPADPTPGDAQRGARKDDTEAERPGRA